MKHTIVIYFDEPGKLDYPLNYTIYYESYNEFSKVCAKQDVQLYFCRGESYRGNMQFSSGYVFKDNQLIDVPHPINADLVYLKGLGKGIQAGPGDLVMNNPEFDALVGDKLKTYEMFGQYMAPCYAINLENWQSVIPKIRTDKVVLKPVTGAGGSGIIITEKAGFDFAQYSLEGPYLAQEFLDTSGGIPGIVDGYHDMRILLFNDQPKLCYIRIPKPGSLLSNISQGASAKAIDITEVPQSVLDICHQVDPHFKKYYPRVYTIDFLFENGRPYLGEINRRPGFPHPTLEGETFSRAFHKNLLETLQQAIQLRKVDK